MKYSSSSCYVARGRLWLLMFLLLVAAVLVVYRLVDLILLDQSFLQRQGNARTLRVATLPAYRGVISDRFGSPLAVSTPVAAIWANPSQIDEKHFNWQQLSRALDISVATLKAKVKRYPQAEFVYIKRGVQPELAEKVKALKLPGIYTRDEFKRFYPEGEVTAHVVGFTNIDDVGQEGLELAYNEWLQGLPGQKKVHKDRLGRVVQDLGVQRQPRAGHDLTLSIDRRLQYIAYRELKAATRRFRTKAGSAVVLDAKTGEVLALVNYPSFNPNQRRKFKPELFRNRAVTDVFEPGSVLKVFPLAMALNAGVYKTDSSINTSPGWLRISGHVIRDIRDYGSLQLPDILKKSSNVGMTKIMLSVDPDDYVRMLGRAGFGLASGSGFPGEAEGLLADHSPWRPHTLATLGFGYSIAVTALQLAQSYSIFTGDGQLKPATFIKQDRPRPKRQVIQPWVSQAMLSMMESVVQHGTGRRAKVAGYRIAGKTGTARVASSSGYHIDKHIASFVGIAPVSDPKVIVAVVLHEPKGEHYYGGILGAPVFAHIMSDTLRMMNIPYDKPLTAKKS